MLLCVFFIISGVISVVIGADKDSIYGFVIGVTLFCVGMYEVIFRPIRLVISHDGVFFSTWGIRIVSWREFYGFNIVQYRTDEFLQFYPKDPELLKKRMSIIGQFGEIISHFQGKPEFSIPYFSYSGPKEEAINFMEEVFSRKN